MNQDVQFIRFTVYDSRIMCKGSHNFSIKLIGSLGAR